MKRLSFRVPVAKSGSAVSAQGKTGLRKRRRGSSLRLEKLEDRRLLTGVLWVTTTDDSGEGSLREAITQANADQGHQEIRFNIDGSGVHSILPLSPLPAIQDRVSIDATSQTGYVDSPLIEIAGVEVSGIGLRFIAGSDGSLVRGLVINRFQVGIHISGSGNHVIESNYIGTDPTGLSAKPNSDGIFINGGAGSNRIGTDGDGINDLFEGNLISGNTAVGIRIGNVWANAGSDGNTVAGNRIGTNRTGEAALANRVGIVLDTGSNNVIGTNGDGNGDDVEGNLISGNTDVGILLAYAVRDAKISGNLIGTDVSGSSAIPNGIGINFQNVADVWAHEGVVIGTDADGISDELERNVISGNTFHGILVTARHHTVAGNIVGLDASGTKPIPNRWGIAVASATHITIGTNGDGIHDEVERNIVSGNLGSGIVLQHTSRTRISGNYVGTDINGLGAIGNGDAGGGIYLAYGSITFSWEPTAMD